MDEATAAMDDDTDQIVQRAVRRCFRDSTLLVIAHRIKTIIDCDQVLPNLAPLSCLSFSAPFCVYVFPSYVSSSPPDHNPRHLLAQGPPPSYALPPPPVWTRLLFGVDRRALRR
jgi:hypothetical protein